MNIIYLLIIQTLSAMGAIDCTRLKYDNEERAYLDYSTELFSGKCECVHENGVRSIENSFRNGLLHGRSFIWYPNGQINSEGQYMDGKRIGTFTTYFMSGNEESEIIYGDNERMLKMTKWSETGEILITIGK